MIEECVILPVFEEVRGITWSGDPSTQPPDPELPPQQTVLPKTMNCTWSSCSSSAWIHVMLNKDLKMKKTSSSSSLLQTSIFHQKNTWEPSVWCRFRYRRLLSTQDLCGHRAQAHRHIWNFPQLGSICGERMLIRNIWKNAKPSQCEKASS